MDTKHRIKKRNPLINYPNFINDLGRNKSVSEGKKRKELVILVIPITQRHRVSCPRGSMIIVYRK